MNNNTASLAQRCFDSQNITMELFERVNELLGCNSHECTKTDFEWGATDTSFDEYDCSVEVHRPASAQWMTQEQANSIMDLGFSGIYETIGETGRLWTRFGNSPCRPGTSDEVLRLREQIKQLRKLA